MTTERARKLDEDALNRLMQTREQGQSDPSQEILSAYVLLRRYSTIGQRMGSFVVKINRIDRLAVDLQRELPTRRARIRRVELRNRVASGHSASALL